MIPHHPHPLLIRTLLIGALPFGFAACTSATPAAADPAAAAPPLGIDLGSSAGQVTRPANATSANPIGAGHEILPPAGTPAGGK